ncbi:hypothetical protein [Paraburkholderia sp. SIMBA_030]|uniref:hypothetical protein n=1 Tax=Paraburkholderia sp. SIMBA_030 TaxID=3085773 RepID=UPI00397D923E
MAFTYHGWIVDTTPDFSLGKFFAHARLTRASLDDDVDTEVHIERNHAWFDNEEEAIESAGQSAIAWINERDSCVASTQAAPPLAQ